MFVPDQADGLGVASVKRVGELSRLRVIGGERRSRRQRPHMVIGGE